MPKRKRPAASAAKRVKITEGISVENSYYNPDRTVIPLWSFNWAIGGGLPHRTIMEIAGFEFVGKSSVGDFLCGCVRKAGTVIVLPFEISDQRYFAYNLEAAGFRGVIWFAPAELKGRPLTQEESADLWLDKLEEDEEACSGLFDSISAFAPVSTMEGSVGDANMGRKALVMKNFLGRCEGILLRRRKTNANVFLINHLHPNIGVPGNNTSGGKAIHNHSATRIRLKAEEKFEDGSILIDGQVTKCRFQGPAGLGAKFKIVLKSGQGVHPGLTAVRDCCDLGLATLSDGYVTMGGKKYGLMLHMIRDKFNDADLFRPFQAALAKHEG